MRETTATIAKEIVGHALTAMVFVSDHDSENTIRQSLADLNIPVAQAEFVSGTVEAATASLSQRASPRLLVVDIGGVANGPAQLAALAKVCEPSTGVVVIGNDNDIRLYRELKNAGVAEYVFKPLVRRIVTQTFSTVLTGGIARSGVRSGRLVFVLGVRGGVGATTIAVNTAWQLAEEHRRWVMLLDLDTVGGDAALQLDTRPTHALTEALQNPDRVDELFLDRGTIHVTPRLDLLASLERLGEEVTVNEHAVTALLKSLLQRYRFVFVDIPAPLAARLPQVMRLPSLCILVGDASLASARDVARWRELLGQNTPDRTTLHILNDNEVPGTMPESESTRITGKAPDIIIRHQREIEEAAPFGVKGVQGCKSLHRALAPIIRQLAGEEPEKQSSFFSRWFRS